MKPRMSTGKLKWHHDGWVRDWALGICVGIGFTLLLVGIFGVGTVMGAPGTTTINLSSIYADYMNTTRIYLSTGGTRSLYHGTTQVVDLTGTTVVLRQDLIPSGSVAIGGPSNLFSSVSASSANFTSLRADSLTVSLGSGVAFNSNFRLADGAFLKSGGGAYPTIVSFTYPSTVGWNSTWTHTGLTATSPTIQGTVSAGTGLTMPAFTLGGTVTATTQRIEGGVFASPTMEGIVSAGTGLTMPAFTTGGNITVGSSALNFKVSANDIITLNTDSTMNFNSRAISNLKLGSNANGNGAQFYGLSWVNSTNVRTSNIYPTAGVGDDVYVYGHLKPGGTMDIGSSATPWRDIILSSSVKPSSNNTATVGLSGARFSDGYFVNLHVLAGVTTGDILFAPEGKNPVARLFEGSDGSIYAQNLLTGQTINLFGGVSTAMQTANPEVGAENGTSSFMVPSPVLLYALMSALLVLTVYQQMQVVRLRREMRKG